MLLAAKFSDLKNKTLYWRPPGYTEGVRLQKVYPLSRLVVTLGGGQAASVTSAAAAAATSHRS